MPQVEDQETFRSTAPMSVRCKTHRSLKPGSARLWSQWP